MHIKTVTTIHPNLFWFNCTNNTKKYQDLYHEDYFRCGYFNVEIGIKVTTQEYTEYIRNIKKIVNILES